MPDTFVDLGSASYGAAIDDYQPQMDDFDLRGPNTQFIGSSGNYDEEGSLSGENGSNVPLDNALEKIEELENVLSGAGGCTTIYFNDGIYNTVTGSACLSIREDGKADITWSLSSSSRIATGGGAGGQYNFRGIMRSANGGFAGYIESSNGPYCPFQWSSEESFTKSASGAGVSKNVIPASVSYVDWFITGNPPAGTSYLT